MTALSTPRLLLLPLDRSMIAARLESEDFTLKCETPDGFREVAFGPEWPGDALSVYPFLLSLLDDGLDEVVDGTWVLVDRATGLAVGQAGSKGGADEHGRIEIGYGVNASERARGLATEAVGAIVAELLARPDVSAVTAETAVDNIASHRVLENNGFVRTGTSHNADDGDLVTWER